MDVAGGIELLKQSRVVKEQASLGTGSAILRALYVIANLSRQHLALRTSHALSHDMAQYLAFRKEV